MKYIIIDKTRGDEFSREFNDKDEAIKEAKKEWEHQSAHDKKECEEFYVLESVDPDEEATNHFDGNYIWVAKMKDSFVVRNKEVGTEIEILDDITSAIECIKSYEDVDKTNGEYEDDFYEIYCKATEEVV